MAAVYKYKVMAATPSLQGGTPSWGGPSFVDDISSCGADTVGTRGTAIKSLVMPIVYNHNSLMFSISWGKHTAAKAGERQVLKRCWPHLPRAPSDTPHYNKQCILFGDHSAITGKANWKMKPEPHRSPPPPSLLHSATQSQIQEAVTPVCCRFTFHVSPCSPHLALPHLANDPSRLYCKCRGRERGAEGPQRTWMTEAQVAHTCYKDM